MVEAISGLTKKDLEELLRPTLQAENTNIEDFSVRYLTKPGDNYGSTMLAVDVNLSPGPRTLSLVAKMLPKSPDMQELFQCEVTVRKEIDMYLLVKPALERLQKENNVPEDKFLNVIPFCYGARVSSKGDSCPVDETSVILQENLKIKGFESGDRFVGLDLAHCKLVVDNLARFHATAIAMKIKKPEEFQTTVLRAVTDLTVTSFKPNIAKAFEDIPEYETLKERINTAFVKGLSLYTSSIVPPNRPFTTMTHLDLWTNNIMFKYESGSSKDNPQSLRFVDYQVTRYDSPVRDLLFFLYTSAHIDILTEHYDFLVRFYFDSFLDCLKTLRCDITPFTFDDFLEEFEHASAIEFFHIAFILSFIQLPASDGISTADLTHENIKNSGKPAETFLPRAIKFVSDFASRDWI